MRKNAKFRNGEWTECLGFEIAETRFAKEHILELLASILYDLSFMGF